MQIIKATAEHISEMNALILASKRFWGYSEEIMALWLDDLRVDAQVLASRSFWVVQADARLAGVFSISQDRAGCELEDFWVHPECMGEGLGRFMFAFVVQWLVQQDVTEMTIVADRHAKAFYERMGAEQIGNVTSQPAGRTLPLMRFRPKQLVD